jgi:hypothetical protein
MAMQASGQIKMSEMAAEFGDSTPYQMSEYYGGGSLVPAGANPGISTSGMIRMNNFHGSVAATVLTISSNVNNYDIGAQAISAGGDKSTPVILTINSGVTVGSTTSATAAMYTGTGWSSGTSITITNNGSLVGAVGNSTTGSGGSGGTGGQGAGPGGPCKTGRERSGGPGGTGGTGTTGSGATGGSAFEHSQTADNYLSVVFSTAGTRTAGSAGTYTAQGGGGGGGGGKLGYDGTAGGGGGGGAAYGSGGSRNRARYYYPYQGCSGYSQAGSSGGATAGGSGGAKYGNCGGTGGSGGGLASNGSGGYSGCGPYGPNGSGGSAGSAFSNTGSAGSVLSGNTGQIS